MNVYAKWGVPTIINCAGPVTRLGGALIADQVVRRMAEAAAESVSIEELQAAASRFIAEITGTTAGLVTVGAAAAVTLGTAAVLTGLDIRRMEQLPDTHGFPNEFLVARDQRNAYDRAVRAAGGKLIEVGFDEVHAGAGVRRCEPWEFAQAIGPHTAGIFYVYRDNAQPPLEAVVEVAHSRGLPVLVDAAGFMGTLSALRRLVSTGADLFAFSGGKVIGGPQASGFLCGRQPWIAAAALQMLDMDEHWQLWQPPEDWIPKSQLVGLPRHGIGRAMKVSKELIIGLLTALELYVQDSAAEVARRSRWRLEQIAAALAPLHVTYQWIEPADSSAPPKLRVVVDELRLGRTALDVCSSLRSGCPPIYVNTSELSRGAILIDASVMRDDQLAAVIRRLSEELGIIRMA
jgi:L-seryl-tRNA(Ser) seleniumtransferase